MGYDLTSVNVPQPSEEELNRLLDEAVASARDPLAGFQAVYDALESTGCFFRFNYVAWPKLLELAVAHGWEPIDDEEEYIVQNGKQISQADARNLADALVRALIELQNIKPLQASSGYLPPGSRPGWMPDDPHFHTYGPRDDLSPEAFWAGNEGKLRRFIAFARRGPFTIS